MIALLVGELLARARRACRFCCEVLAGEARTVAAEVVLVELVRRGEAPRQEPAPERRVGDEPMPSSRSVGRISSSTSRVHSEYSRLHGRDRVHGVRAADRLGAGLGEADVADLALLHQFGHRADGLLDRRVGVDAVLVVEVDVVDAQALQRALAAAWTYSGLPSIEPSVDSSPGVAELDRRTWSPGRPRRAGPAIARPTSRSLVCGPYMSEVSRKLQPSSSARAIVASASSSSVAAVEGRHAHAAQTDRRDLRARRSERALASFACSSSSGLAKSVRAGGAARSAQLASGIMGSPMFPLNLPNVLTVLRIMLVPVLVVALLGNTPAGDVLAAVVFALASLTDFVDGCLARARGSITTFGKLMDPLADKLLIVAALISLVSLHRLAAWVAMVIITRELAVTVLRLGATQAGVVIAASMFGKVKTCLQIAAILA